MIVASNLIECQIEAKDEQVDALMYESYRLTEEVEVVEGGNH